MKRTLSLLGLLAASSAASCSTDDAQLVVVLHSDYEIPTELTRLEVRVEAAAGGSPAVHGFDLARPNQLPLSFGIAPPSGDRRAAVIIVVTPSGPGVGAYPPIRRTLPSFPEDRSSITIFVTRACGTQLCEGGQTCLVNACGRAEVDAGELDPLGGAGEELEGVCIPGARRCTADRRGIETCVSSGEPPERMSCPGDQRCLVGPVQCGRDGEIFHRLQVSVTGSGFIQSNPPGINCGADGGPDCTRTYLAGTSVQLSPQLSPNVRLAAWGGACAGSPVTGPCELSLSDDLSVTAAFENITSRQYSLSLGTQGSGAGTIEVNGGVFNCPPDCNLSFGANTTVDLDARVGPDSSFLGWFGACSAFGTDPKCSVQMTEDLAAVASFEPARAYSLFVSVSGDGRVYSSDPTGLIDCGTGAGSTDCSESFGQSTSVELTAVPTNPNSIIAWNHQSCSDGELSCIVWVEEDLRVDVEIISGPVLPTMSDVNDDGFDDLVVGAPGFDLNGQPDAGRVYLFFGPRTAQSLPADSADRIYEGWGGAAAGSQTGAALSVGDVTGDGIPDILVGSPGAAAIHLIYGGSLPPSGSISSASHTIQDPNYPSFGRSLTVLRDVNNDNRLDLAVGAPDAEAVFVFFGRTSFQQVANAASADVRMGGGGAIPVPAPRFGEAVASVGDVNGDSGNDLLVGAPMAGSTLGFDEEIGVVHVFSSGSGGWSMSSPPPMPIATIEGTITGGRFGTSLTPVEDIDGDSFPDFAMGSDRGGYVSIFTRSNLEGTVFPLVASAGHFQLVGGGRFGASLAGLGDVTGDGVPELHLGAPEEAGASRGAAHLYTLATQVSLLSHHQGDCVDLGRCQLESLGVSVGSIGDVNGDGSRDVAIGSQFGGGAVNASNRGRVVVFHGPQFPSGSSSSADLEILGENQSDAAFHVLPNAW